MKAAAYHYLWSQVHLWIETTSAKQQKPKARLFQKNQFDRGNYLARQPQDKLCDNSLYKCTIVESLANIRSPFNSQNDNICVDKRLAASAGRRRSHGKI
jgi:hypothetical protein